MTWRAISARPYLLALLHASDAFAAVIARIVVERCRLAVSKPVLKALMVSVLEATT